MPGHVVPAEPTYDCSRCPGWCCAGWDVEVTSADVRRLAKHFDVDEETARRRFTKTSTTGGRLPILRQKRDHIFETTCTFFDQKERRCTVYGARPKVCRSYPFSDSCHFYAFLKAEREFQNDDEVTPHW